jgi:threonine/homoserine/homoserine lactone efflux protein
MTMLTNEFVLQIIMSIGAAVGVYAGIKSDLAVTREKAQNAQSNASLAHRRIDDLIKDTK